MKKVLAAVLCLALALSLAACGAKTADTSNNNAVTDEHNDGDALEDDNTVTDGAQLANPFVEYDTLAEAEQAAGYSFAVPETVDGYSGTFYSVMNSGELLQVIYRSDADELVARKAPGDGDISGDYTEYERQTIADNGDLPSVTFKGNTDKVYLALWTDETNGYTYSLMSRAGMEPDLFNAFVNSIINGEAAEFANVPLAGGWTVNDGELSMESNPDAMAAFEKAVDGLSGYSYEPLVLVGSQLVAGMNYCILCRGTVVTPDAVPTYELVTVYADLDGNAEITNSTVLPGLPETVADLPGGWTLNTGDTAPDANPDVITALEKALDGLAGAGYEAAAYLASQVVAGENYLIFCRVTPVVPDAVPAFALVTVYADLDGNAEITDVTDVTI